MGKLVKEKAKAGRLHIESGLMGESLVDKKLLRRTEAKDYFRMHPDVNVLKIGGQSIMDRGAKAVLPILDVLIKAKDKHKMILMTGGGTRAGTSTTSAWSWACPPECSPSWGTRSPGKTRRCWRCCSPSTAG